MRSRLITSLKKVNRFILTIPNGYHHVTNTAQELINTERPGFGLLWNTTERKAP